MGMTIQIKDVLEPYEVREALTAEFNVTTLFDWKGYVAPQFRDSWSELPEEVRIVLYLKARVSLLQVEANTLWQNRDQNYEY